MNEPNKVIPNQMIKPKSPLIQYIGIGVVIILILAAVGGGSWWYFTGKKALNNPNSPATPPKSLTSSTINPRIDFPIPIDDKAVQSAVVTYVLHTYIEDIKEYKKDAQTPKDMRWITLRYKAPDFGSNFQLADSTKYFTKSGTKKVAASFASLKKGQPISITLDYRSKKQLWEVKEIIILPTLAPQPKKATPSAQARPATTSAQPASAR